MKKVLCSFIVTFLVLIGLSSSVHINADEYYDIRDYDVQINVLENNNYEITETILVEFYSPRHGIFRDIDTYYIEYNHRIRDIKVTDASGNKLKTEKTKNRYSYNIRIGDEDEYVTGLQRYVISYTYVGNDDFNTLQDEFYFNIIGTQWDAAIDNVDFTIEMPKAFDTGKLNVTSSYYGNISNDHVVFEVKGNTITGTTTEVLKPYEGISVALVLPEGYYVDIEPWVSENLVTVLVFAMVLLLVIAILYAKKYNNKNQIEMVLMGQAPDGMNSAELAYIHKDEQINNSDVGSLIMEWASLGYLEIKEVKTGLTSREDTQLIKLKDLEVFKPRYERKLFKALFKRGGGATVYKSQLTQKFYSDMAQATNAIREKYSDDKEILLNKVQLESKLMLIASALIFTIMVSLIAHQLFGGSYLAVLGFTCLLVVGLTVDLVVQKLVFMKGSFSTKIIVGASMTFFTVVFGIVLLSELWPQIKVMWSRLGMVGPMILAMLVLYMLVLFVLSTVKKYTPYGLKVKGQVEGFKQFIEESRGEEIKKYHSENPDYIYQLLPYAMVFGLSNRWEKLVDSIGLGQSSPYWYHGRNQFNSDDFTRSMRSTVSSVSSSPSSSGSSSGGSSGGGGGGGGGGSW